jgi:ubiquinone/menaquinone biosynthesis C-methylase UbiE
MKKTSMLNKENYDIGSDAYDTHVTSKRSYNSFAETPYMKQLLQSQSGQKILDFCCGTGRYSNWLAEQYSEVIGIDFSKQSIQLARQKAEKKQLLNIQYYTGSIDMLKDSYCQYFDGINWGMGLNYFQDLDAVLDVLQYCLKPHGWLVCSLVHPIIWAGEYIQNDEQQYGRSVFKYFTPEMKEFQWENVTRDDGNPFVTRNYPHNFESLTTSFSNNNLFLERILEPQPITEGEALDQDLYNRLAGCPQFAIVKAVKKN